MSMSSRPVARPLQRAIPGAGAVCQWWWWWWWWVVGWYVVGVVAVVVVPD